VKIKKNHKEMTLFIESDKLCEELTLTYDARIIKKYSKELQDIVMDIAVKNKDIEEDSRRNKRTKENYTLISLINNLNNFEKLPKADFISGPTSIIKYNKGSKNIYLFGEKHEDKNCSDYNIKTNVHIIDYLIKLFTYTPVFIDFYVEFELMFDKVPPISPNSGQTLHRMLDKMSGCFGEFSNRNCPYNVRMHSVDIRMLYGERAKIYNEEIYGLMSDLNMINIIKNRGSGKKDGVIVTEWMSYDEFMSKYKDIVDKLCCVSMHKIVVDIIKKNSLFQKVIKKSELNTTEIIRFFVVKSLTTFKNKGCDFTSINKWFQQLKSSDKFPEYIELVSVCIIVIVACLMDIYTTLRMFKKFKIKKDEHYPSDQNNIIYYAGDGHTIQIARFLEKIGFERKESSISDMISCLNMKNIKQPLFSE